MIYPACVIAGVVIVGDIDNPPDSHAPPDAPDPMSSLSPDRIEYLHTDVDVRGLEVAMEDALFVSPL